MIPLTILCPGQGAQEVGMGRSFFDAFASARAVFERADELLGFALSAVCFEGPVERLNQTDIAQPAIYVTSLAAHAAAVEAGRIDPTRATQFAGLSLGEYTALHLAGVFDFATGLKLVSARGRLMQAAARARPGSMVAVIGGDEAQVESLCQASREDEVLVPANFNAPGQIVVSGSVGACDRFTAAATAAGLRAVPLAVAGAFHSPLMHGAADAMQQLLQTADLHAPRATVFSNVTAEPHGDVASIRRLLVEQIVKPVRWSQTMARLAPLEGATFLELAPGKVLSGLLKKQNRRAAIETLDTAQTLTR